MLMIGKVISSGQTGADRGALEAALKRKVGWRISISHDL